MSLPEHRAVEFRDAELDGMNFRGYAAVFDSPWNDGLTQALGYVESVARGAFRKAIGQADVPLLWNHDRNALLATTGGDTLRLREDGKGLLVEANLPQTGLGEYVRELIDRGDVRGMSYGMETKREDSVLSKRDGVMHRSIANIRRLLDVTLTYDPAYPATTVELRSDGLAALTLQELTAGEEAQSGDTAADVPPPNRWANPVLAGVLIEELDRGGITEWDR